MKTLIKSALLFCLLAVPAGAGAQTMNWFVSPYVGGTFAGPDLSTNGAPTVGISGGWIGAGHWGLEGDLAETVGFFAQDGFLTNRRVTTAMGNVLMSVRSESQVNVYVAGGVGLIRPRLSEAGDLLTIDVKQPGFNVGAGINWMRNGMGVRGDVRYFRSVGEEENDENGFDLEVSTLHFVRASVGLVVGF